MEVSTSSATINNFVTTVLMNFNVQIILNLLFYSAAIAAGVLTTSKLITFLFEELVGILRYKWTVKYKNKTEEIRELNNKMHDKLVDFEAIIKENEYPSENLKRRLRLNASRMGKYDNTISDDVNLLIENWIVMLSLYERGNINTGQVSKVRSEEMALIKTIKLKINNL